MQLGGQTEGRGRQKRALERVDSRPPRRTNGPVRMTECPVCLEAVIGPDNSIGCPNRHFVCLICAARTVKPCHFCESTECTGMLRSCPICRGVSIVRPTLAMAMLHGSWKAVSGMHASKEAKAYWEAQSELVAHVDPPSSDDSDADSDTGKAGAL